MTAKHDLKKLQPGVFGRRLRQARTWAGTPQDQLGVAIGLDESTSSSRISRYETGVHEPPIPTAKLLAAELNVPLAFLYCDDEDLALALLGLHAMSTKELRCLVKEQGWAWPKKAPAGAK